MTESIAHPKIASQEEWLAFRKTHLAHEKEAMKASVHIPCRIRQ
jgi:predicted dithiol-disulfide oxidoreductase (DUF899 family)